MSKQPLHLMIEREFDAYLFGGNKGLATELGWQSYHTLRSRGSRAGYPDRTVWRDRLFFVETKVGKNTLSDFQVEVLTGMARAGAEVYVWRNTDADVDEAGHVMGSKWRFAPPREHIDSGFDARAGVLVSPTGYGVQPDTLWTTAGCLMRDLRTVS